MMLRRPLVSAVVLLSVVGVARAGKPADLPGGACTGKALACASSATPLLLPDGTLWLAWAAGGTVSIARSTDQGRSFDPAVVVDPVSRVVDAGPDARPKIVRDAAGRLVVAWSYFKDDDWNAQVLVSRSIDGGHSFSTPHPLSGDPASQRFEALESTPSGALFAAWIDKRDAVAAKRAGRAYPGAALAYAWSRDGGETFAGERIAGDNSCECCRLGLALDGKGHPVVLFRNIYGANVRDHAVTTFTDAGTPGPLHRVSVDDYAIDGCPHHGPSLAVSGTGTYHAAWFTDGKARQGVFYARSTDDGLSFSSPLPLAGPERHGGRPYVLATPQGVWLAWKEFDGEHTLVRTMVSRDDGVSWSKPQTVAQTDDTSDHPLLVSDGRRTFLSWMTHKDGYRLIPLDMPS